MLERGGITDDLNISTTERLKAILAGILALAIIAPAAVPGFVSWWAPGALLVAAGAANLNVLRRFNRRRGPFFALRGLLMHQFYYLYSSAAFVWPFLKARLFSGN